MLKKIRQTIEGKKVLILGFGREGRSSLRLVSGFIRSGSRSFVSLPIKILLSSKQTSAKSLQHGALWES